MKITSDVEKILIRQLATSQVLQWFERTYRIIYGFEIALMQYARRDSGITHDGVRSFCSELHKKHPDFFEGWDIDNYLGFLSNSELIDITKTHIKTTDRGNDFLQILQNTGYDSEKSI